jgi:hypothetical protein
MCVVPVVDVRDALEAGRKAGSNLPFSHIPVSPWALASRHVQDTVIMEVVHDGVEVMAVEGVQEGSEGLLSNIATHRGELLSD